MSGCACSISCGKITIVIRKLQTALSESVLRTWGIQEQEGAGGRWWFGIGFGGLEWQPKGKMTDKK